MAWRRLPAYLPNLSLKPLPLTEAQQQVYEKTGFLKELVFKTAPSVGKVRAAPPSSATFAAAIDMLLLPCGAAGRDQGFPGERVRPERDQGEHAERRGEEEARQARVLQVRLSAFGEAVHVWPVVKQCQLRYGQSTVQLGRLPHLV
jgi:hypothetical protein